MADAPLQRNIVEELLWDPKIDSGEGGHRADRRAGRGARGDWRNAHFGRFVALLDDYLACRADPGFQPARPVEPAYVQRPPDVNAETATITDPLTTQVADLFNAVYETTLQALSRYFVHSGETDDQLTTLAKTAKHLMNWVMRPLGSILTTLPIGPHRPGMLAGPAFEIVQPSFYVLPHRQAAWRDPGRAARRPRRPRRPARRHPRTRRSRRAGHRPARHGPGHRVGLAQHRSGCRPIPRARRRDVLALGDVG